jgi:general secretion pathway protein E
MGVEPYQLAAGFRGALAQRLVRRLCQRCAAPGPATEAEVQFAEVLGRSSPSNYLHPVGCTHCRRTGFRGRIPIAEAFLADDDVLRGLAERRSQAELAEIARAAGLRGMAEDGFEKALEGQTTCEEVAAAIHG